MFLGAFKFLPYSESRQAQLSQMLLEIGHHVLPRRSMSSASYTPCVDRSYLAGVAPLSPDPQLDIGALSCEISPKSFGVGAARPPAGTGRVEMTGWHTSSQHSGLCHFGRQPVDRQSADCSGSAG